MSILDESVCGIGGLIMVRGNKKYPGKKTLLHCHVIHHEPHMGWPGIEPGPPCFSFVPVTLRFRCHIKTCTMCRACAGICVMVWYITGGGYRRFGGVFCLNLQVHVHTA